MKEKIRINKYIADLGICSRRKSDDLIIQGEVKLNGEVVTDLGTKVNTEKDIVTVQNVSYEPRTQNSELRTGLPSRFSPLTSSPHATFPLQFIS